MSYVPELFKFLDELAENNNRVWFKENKQRFDSLRQQWIADLDLLRSRMIEWEPALAKQPLADCPYRIYRDTRFSPDKTPYKTYLSALFSPVGKKGFYPAYYFQMGSSQRTDLHSGLYGGMWCPPSDILRKVRKAIVDNEEEFNEITADPQLNKEFPGWFGDSLKTVPRGFDKNSPLAPVLKLKEYGRAHILTRDFFLRSNWIEEASELFRILKPLNDFLTYSIEEEV